MLEPPSEEVEEAVVPIDGKGVGTEGDQQLCDGNERTDSPSVQNDVTLEDTDAKTDEDELYRLLEEDINFKDELAGKEFELKSFKGDGEKVRFYTGLPSFASILAMLIYLSENLPQGRTLSLFQTLTVVLMRLRLKLPVQHIFVWAEEQT